MKRLQEWQKELLGLGMGAWVVHLLIATVLIMLVVHAMGGFGG